MTSPTGPQRREATSRSRLSYLAFGRLIPAILYIVLGYLIVGHVIDAYRGLGAHPSLFALAAGPVRWTLYFLFCIMPVAIYLTRPMPRARDSSVAAWAAAMVGTLILLVVGATLGNAGPLLFHVPDWLIDACALVLAAATALGVAGLAYLRHSFSIVPEARRVVRSGPYSVMRHPLYLSEILVALALLIPGSSPEFGPRLVPTVSWLLFLAVQRLRIHYEESLLSRTFADYSDYSSTTARLVPFIW